MFQGWQIDDAYGELQAISQVMRGGPLEQLTKMLEAELRKPGPDLSRIIALHTDKFHCRGSTVHFSLKFMSSNAQDQQAQRTVSKYALWKMMPLTSIHTLYMLAMHFKKTFISTL